VIINNRNQVLLQHLLKNNVPQKQIPHLPSFLTMIPQYKQINSYQYDSLTIKY